MWAEIEPFVWLAIVVGAVFAGKWLANRKASKLRQEGRQQAYASIGARMATGHQTVMVDASGRLRDEASTRVSADLDRAEQYLHLAAGVDDDGRVPGELGRGLRSVGRPDEYGVDLGDAPVVRPRHPDGHSHVRDVAAMTEHERRTDWSIEDPWEGSSGA